MSNFFPAGRLYQKLMIALDGAVNLKLITAAVSTTNTLKQYLITNYATYSGLYPTIESFKEMLDTINLIHINGGTYSLDGTNSVGAPADTAGGIYIHGAETFNRIKVTGNAKVALYSKPTP